MIFLLDVQKEKKIVADDFTEYNLQYLFKFYFFACLFGKAVLQGGRRRKKKTHTLAKYIFSLALALSLSDSALQFSFSNSTPDVLFMIYFNALESRNWMFFFLPTFQPIFLLLYCRLHDSFCSWNILHMPNIDVELLLKIFSLVCSDCYSNSLFFAGIACSVFLFFFSV